MSMARKFFSVLLLSLAVSFVDPVFLPGSSTDLGNAGLETEEIVKKHGYSVETHNVETEDGYIISLHRIPHDGRNVGRNRPAVLLLHGLASSGNTFLIIGPTKALGFILANNGYDVWLLNARGSRYSLRHVKHTTNDPKFWDFSFHEIGQYDLSKTVDFILNLTNVRKLSCVAHSMGSAAVMVLLSTRPEYNSKINLVINFAPGVFNSRTISIPLLFLLQKEAAIVQLKGNQEWIPGIDNITEGFWRLCDPKLLTTVLCRTIYTTLGGASTSINQASLPEVMSVFPSAGSARTFAHYQKNKKDGKFRFYDYGPEENFERYQSSEAPIYNLSLVTTPVAIFYADADLLVRPEDALELNRTLPNVIFLYKVPEAAYNHMDYIYGDTSVSHVYVEVLKLLKRISLVD